MGLSRCVAEAAVESNPISVLVLCLWEKYRVGPDHKFLFTFLPHLSPCAPQQPPQNLHILSTQHTTRHITTQKFHYPPHRIYISMNTPSVKGAPQLKEEIQNVFTG